MIGDKDNKIIGLLKNLREGDGISLFRSGWQGIISNVPARHAPRWLSDENTIYLQISSGYNPFLPCVTRNLNIRSHIGSRWKDEIESELVLAKKQDLKELTALIVFRNFERLIIFH